MENNSDRAIQALRRLERHNPDFVEIRFDRMKATPDIAEIRDATDRPLIATNRRRDQGGWFSGREKMRLAVLKQAVKEGFEYVDLELKTRNLSAEVRHLKQQGARVIVSHHNGRTTPSQRALESIIARQKLAVADICKIVGTANNYTDNLRYIAFVNDHAKKARLVCFAMGRLGIPSRVLSPIFGAHFTFASSDQGRETASGQLPIQRLRDLYKELGVT